MRDFFNPIHRNQIGLSWTIIIIIIIIIIIKLSIRTTPPQTILNFNSVSKFKQTIEIRRLK